MATFFALDTLVRAREEKLYVSFMKILKNLYTQHVPVRASSYTWVHLACYLIPPTLGGRDMSCLHRHPVGCW